MTERGEAALARTPAQAAERWAAMEAVVEAARAFCELMAVTAPASAYNMASIVDLRAALARLDAEDLDAWKLVRHPPSTGAGRSVATDPLDELVRQCVALGDVHTALCRLVMHLGYEIRDRDRQLAARLTGAPRESAEPWYALSITGDTEANHLVRGDEALRAALRDAFFIDTNPDHLAAEEAARWAHVQDPARWRAGVWEEHGEDYVVTIVRVGGAIRPKTQGGEDPR